MKKFILLALFVTSMAVYADESVTNENDVNNVARSEKNSIIDRIFNRDNNKRQNNYDNYDNKRYNRRNYRNNDNYDDYKDRNNYRNNERRNERHYERNNND